jgi:hypothetical protein
MYIRTGESTPWADQTGQEGMLAGHALGRKCLELA